MAIKKYKPTSNGRRNMTSSDFAEITTDKPEKSLLAPLNEKAVVITKVKLLFVIKVADISVNTVLSISNAIKMAFQDALLLSNTIQTALQTSH